MYFDVKEPGVFDLLRVAAVEGHAEICSLLLDGGAEADKVVNGATALMVSTSNPHST